MEHGLTPGTIALLTYLSAPNNSGYSSGLLNVGSQFIGTMENTATLLAKIHIDPAGVETSVSKLLNNARMPENICRVLVTTCTDRMIRSPKLFAIAAAYEDIDQRPISTIKALGAVVDEIYGKHPTINATGATAAVLMGAGIPARIMRGFAVISRAAGLVAHVMEEQETPTGRAIWNVVDNCIPYTGKAE